MRKEKGRDRDATMRCVDFPAVDDCRMELSTVMMWGEAEVGFPLYAIRRVPGDASSVFRRDAEAFSGAPGSTGAAPACIDLSVLLL